MEVIDREKKIDGVPLGCQGMASQLAVTDSQHRCYEFCLGVIRL